MNTLHILGGGLVLCTLGGGALWLLDSLLEQHIPPGRRLLVSTAIAGVGFSGAVFALALVLITIGKQP